MHNRALSKTMVQKQTPRNRQVSGRFLLAGPTVAGCEEAWKHITGWPEIGVLNEHLAFVSGDPARCVKLTCLPVFDVDTED